MQRFKHKDAHCRENIEKPWISTQEIMIEWVPWDTLFYSILFMCVCVCACVCVHTENFWKEILRKRSSGYLKEWDWDIGDEEKYFYILCYTLKFLIRASVGFALKTNLQKKILYYWHERWQGKNLSEK